MQRRALGDGTAVTPLLLAQAHGPRSTWGDARKLSKSSQLYEKNILFFFLVSLLLVSCVLAEDKQRMIPASNGVTAMQPTRRDSRTPSGPAPSPRREGRRQGWELSALSFKHNCGVFTSVNPCVYFFK